MSQISPAKPPKKKKRIRSRTQRTNMAATNQQQQSQTQQSLMNVSGSSSPFNNVQVSDVFHQLQPLHMQPQPSFQAFQPNIIFGTAQPSVTPH